MATYLANEMPPELILALADYLSLSSVNSLVQTSVRLHSILQPVLDASLTPQIAREVLFKSAGEGKLEIVKKLLSPPYSVDPNGDSMNPCTPLHVAAEAGHADIVKLLLEKNADVTRRWDSSIDEEMQPLHLAVRANHVEVVRLLLQYGADPNVGYGEWGAHSICDAAFAGNIDMVATLHAHGADLEQKETYGTALGHAVRRRNLQMMEYLLKSGSDVEAKMPLHPGVLCGKLTPPTYATALYVVLALKHPKGEHDPSPIPEDGREAMIKLLMKYGAKRESAMATVMHHVTELAESEGVSKEQLLEKVDNIFAKAACVQTSMLLHAV